MFVSAPQSDMKTTHEEHSRYSIKNLVGVSDIFFLSSLSAQNDSAISAVVLFPRKVLVQFYDIVLSALDSFHIFDMPEVTF